MEDYDMIVFYERNYNRRELKMILRYFGLNSKLALNISQFGIDIVSDKKTSKNDLSSSVKKVFNKEYKRRVGFYPKIILCHVNRKNELPFSILEEKVFNLTPEKDRVLFGDREEAKEKRQIMKAKRWLMKR